MELIFSSFVLTFLLLVGALVEFLVAPSVSHCVERSRLQALT